jgi:organic hydroperoxide reductase OsmC/OhrA
MNQLEKVLYTAKAHSTGGRTGTSRSSDGRLEVRLSRPGSPGTGTNPSSSSQPAGPPASIRRWSSPRAT